MPSILRQTWALLIGVAILMLGHGQGTLLGLRANLEAFPAAVTGLADVGLLHRAARGLAARADAGRPRSARAVFAAPPLGSTAILFQALFVEPVAWFLMRCSRATASPAPSSSPRAGSTAAPRTRPAASCRSTWWCRWAAWRPASSCSTSPTLGGFDLFILVSVLISVAAVPMLLTAAAAPTVASPRDIGLLGLYRISPLGVVGIVGIGVAHSGLYSMGPVFASEVGLSVAAISTFHGVRDPGRRAVPGADRPRLRRASTAAG